MRKSFCLGSGVALLLFSPMLASAMSSAIEDTQAERIMFAKSAQEVVLAAKSGEDLMDRRAECSSQTKAGRVPTACFHALVLGMKTGLIALPQFKALLSEVTDHCVREARRSGDLAELRGAVTDAGLSESCRRSIRERIEEIRYMRGANAISDALALPFE